MTNFTPTDPYHRFYLSKDLPKAIIVHTTYEVIKPTRCGAWIKEMRYPSFLYHSGSSKTHWVGQTEKAFAYQDVNKAWYSFQRRVQARFNYAEQELYAVKAVLDYIEEGKAPELNKSIYVIEEEKPNVLF